MGGDPLTADALERIQEARDVLIHARRALRIAEPRAWAVGIGFVDGEVGFNVQLSEPRRASAPKRAPPRHVLGFPVGYHELSGVPTLAGHITNRFSAEQRRMTPPRSGAEIANHKYSSNPQRTGPAPLAGSLGCFVREHQSLMIGFVSCSHVLNPEGICSQYDSIIQPATPAQAHQIGDFERSIDLLPSPAGLLDISDPKARKNLVDIGIALMTSGCKPPVPANEFHESHGLQPFLTMEQPNPGDHVFKVGRRGLIRGKVESVAESLATASHANHAGQEYWFDDVFSIKSLEDEDFVEAGDSGSLVIREADQAIVGMVFATARSLGWAFSLEEGLKQLQCDLYIS